MIQVRLYRRGTGRQAEAGSLEFYGVPVAKRNGSTWIDLTDLGEPRPGQVRLVPAGVATGAEIRTITQALSRNEVRGATGRYEWRAE